jgi:hypothetical protein
MPYVKQFLWQLTTNAFRYKGFFGFLWKYGSLLIALFIAANLITETMPMTFGALLIICIVAWWVAWAAGITWAGFSLIELDDEIHFAGDNRYTLQVFNKGPGTAAVDVSLVDVTHHSGRSSLSSLQSMLPMPCPPDENRPASIANQPAASAVQVTNNVPGRVTAFELIIDGDLILMATGKPGNLPIIDRSNRGGRPASIKIVARHGAGHSEKWFTIEPPPVGSSTCRCPAVSPTPKKLAKVRLVKRALHRLLPCIAPLPTGSKKR